MEFDPGAQASPEGPPLLARLRSDPVDPMLAATNASVLLVRWIHLTRSRRTERAVAEAEQKTVVATPALVATPPLVATPASVTTLVSAITLTSLSRG